MSRCSATVFAVTACLALCAQAQTSRVVPPAPLEVTLAYSADRANGVVGGCGCFWMSGGKAEANANLSHGLSVVAELAGEHASNLNTTGESLSLVTYLFGPRYTFRNSNKFELFAQFLVGGVHGFDALFPSATQSVPNPDAFAFAAGGGLNMNVSRHFAIRALQADYMQTDLSNSATNRQDHLRLSGGIVIRFAGRP